MLNRETSGARYHNPPLHIKGKLLLPIVQGGMGVDISAHRLAGHVARAGAVAKP